MTTDTNPKENEMRKVIYSMGVSLDGFIEGPNRELDWSTPDEELHRFWNDQARKIGTSLYGPRLYELMADYWPTADTNTSALGTWSSSPESGGTCPGSCFRRPWRRSTGMAGWSSQLMES